MKKISTKTTNTNFRVVVESELNSKAIQSAISQVRISSIRLAILVQDLKTGKKIQNQLFSSRVVHASSRSTEMLLQMKVILRISIKLTQATNKQSQSTTRQTKVLSTSCRKSTMKTTSMLFQMMSSSNLKPAHQELNQESNLKHNQEATSLLATNLLPFKTKTFSRTKKSKNRTMPKTQASNSEEFILQSILYSINLRTQRKEFRTWIQRAFSFLNPLDLIRIAPDKQVRR